MPKIREDRYAVLRRHKFEDNRWETLIEGSEEVCLKHCKENARYWYDGEEIVMFKVETTHTPVRRWVGHVTLTEEAL